MADKDDDMTNSTLPKMNLLDEFWSAWKNGAGMFLEAYVTFAIGNIGSIFKIIYPTCYGSPIYNGSIHLTGTGDLECNSQIQNSIPTVEIAAIIVGMIFFGLVGDHMGRLTGLRSTISLYVVGIIGLTVSFGVNLSGLFAMFLIFVIIYCIGVGGEYPMASASASERSEAYQLARGRTVVLTFANQGWGNFINTGIICILLAITQTGACSGTTLENPSNATIRVCLQTGVCPDTTLENVYTENLIGVCDYAGLQVVWRVQYALALPIILWLWYLRFCVFRETEVWKQRQEAKYKNESPAELRAKRWKHTKMLFGRKYIGPLIGCAVGWFVWDIAFYGNKLFQGTIMAAVVGGGNNETLYLILLYTLLNSFISLIGYYFAAFTIDTKWMGRVRMQVMGFAVTCIISLVCGFDFESISKNSQLFLFLYLVQSFFGQWGPNCTTWLLPVELFPTDVRGQAHGISAASGKFGALVATLIFSYGAPGAKPVGAQIIFIVTGFACLVGVLVTIIFVKDVTGVPLKQIDRRWSVDFAEAYGGAPNKVGAVEAQDEADKN